MKQQLSPDKNRVTQCALGYRLEGSGIPDSETSTMSKAGLLLVSAKESETAVWLARGRNGGERSERCEERFWEATYGLVDHRSRNFGFYSEWECWILSRVSWCDWEWERILHQLFRIGFRGQRWWLWHQSEEMIVALTSMLALGRVRSASLIICILKAECTRFADGFHVMFMKKRGIKDETTFSGWATEKELRWGSHGRVRFRERNQVWLWIQCLTTGLGKGGFEKIATCIL